jgi:hypothetical protein
LTRIGENEPYLMFSVHLTGATSATAPYLVSLSLPMLTSPATAFNNTSIQLVKKEALAGLDQEASFWQLPELPSEN